MLDELAILEHMACMDQLYEVGLCGRTWCEVLVRDIGARLVRKGACWCWCVLVRAGACWLTITISVEVSVGLVCQLIEPKRLSQRSQGLVLSGER